MLRLSGLARTENAKTKQLRHGAGEAGRPVPRVRRRVDPRSWTGEVDGRAHLRSTPAMSSSQPQCAGPRLEHDLRWGRRTHPPPVPQGVAQGAPDWFVHLSKGAVLRNLTRRLFATSVSR